MFNAKRKGIALITVVLISALIFASIVGITLKVISENKIVAARSASQRALSAAETGLSQALFNLRNADFTPGGRTTVPPGTTDLSLTYLTIDNVENIAEASAGAASASTTYGEVPVPGGDGVPYVTYQVKIKKVSGDPFNTNYNNSTLDNVLEIYSLGTVYDKQDGSVIARKAVMMNCAITFNVKPATPGSPPSNPVNVNYGIVSGGNMNFVGNANRVFHGDIYAGGDIMKNSNNDNSTIVLDGNAYAHGSVDSGIVANPEQVYEGVSSPSDTIDQIIDRLKDFNKDLADAFMIGNYPYNGSNSDYPNTNRSTLSTDDQTIINNIFNYYLGDNTNFGRVSSFYDDLESEKIYTNYYSGLSATGKTFLQNLANPTYKDKIVCYYKGDVGKKDLTDNIKLGGVLIIDGNLSITSSITINPDNNNLIIRVTGNVDLKGGATLNCGNPGGIFASGENANSKVGVGSFTLNGFLITPRDIDINGTFTCNGSLLTKGNISLQGTTNITYVDRGLGNIQVIPTPPSEFESASLENVASAGQNSSNPSSWQEVSYDKFLNP
jgi:Tfp pilus assembly protein PilX